jgi:uncharacterized protein
MRFLIDGYNLLHRLGLMRNRMAPGELAGARQRLVSLLTKAWGKDAGTICIVYDSAGAPARRAPDRNNQDIDVRFARRGEAADDVIEEVIRNHSAPKQLTVISDDHRLQRAARRRACRVQSCTSYLEEMEHRLRPNSPDRRADPAGAPSPAEDANFWLQTFASIEQDPQLREFFDVDRFPDREEKKPKSSNAPPRARRQL